MPEPGTPARSRLSCVRSVPVRSLTVMVSAPPRALKLIPSTPLRSMVMLATSRVKRTRLPLAEMSIFSLTFAAVEEHRVEAVLSLDGVAAVAGVPDEGVVAGAHEGHVVASAAVDDVVAVAADQDVVAVAAGDGVVARAAVHGERDQCGQAVPGGERVVPAVHVHDQVLGRADVQGERGGGDAVETDAGAVGGDGKRLRAVAAVDLDGVDAGAALVEVGVVAGVPDHPVVARLAEDLVVAVPPVRMSLPSPPNSRSFPPLPSKVSLPAWPKSWSAAEPPVRVSLPSPPKMFAFGKAPLVSFRERLSLPPRPKSWIETGVGDRGLPAQDRHGAAVDQDRPGRVAGDRDGVVLRIADDRQHPLCGGKRGGDRRQDAAIEQLEAGEVDQTERVATAADGPGDGSEQLRNLRFHMSIISKVVRKTQGARRLPKRYLGTDLRRLDPARTAGHAWRTMFLAIPGRPVPLPEGPELSGSHSHATTGQKPSRRVQDAGASPVQ